MRIYREQVGHLPFPPEEIAQIKALACHLPAERGIPLSRFSITEIVLEVISTAIVSSVSDSSVWRWLHEDAIRPWFHRSWIYPNQKVARPFSWKFTRKHLQEKIKLVSEHIIKQFEPSASQGLLNQKVLYQDQNMVAT